MKKEKVEHKATGNGIGNGFMLGLLIGIIITLLLTTKKGRGILKYLIDRGIKKISDLEGSYEKAKEKVQTEEETDYVKPRQEEVKKEIRYLATDSTPKNEVAEPKTKDLPAAMPAGRQGRQEKAEEEKVNEKPEKHEKAVKRLFIRNTQKKH